MRIPFSRFLSQSSALGGLKVIREEAWLFCRTSSGVRLCWELEGPEGPERHGVLLCRLWLLDTSLSVHLKGKAEVQGVDSINEVYSYRLRL